MKFEFTRHAQKVLDEREIPLELDGTDVVRPGIGAARPGRRRRGTAISADTRIWRAGAACGRQHRG